MPTSARLQEFFQNLGNKLAANGINTIGPRFLRATGLFWNAVKAGFFLLIVNVLVFYPGRDEMKKLFALLLIAGCGVSFVGCTGTKTEDPKAKPTEEKKVDAAAPMDTPAPAPTDTPAPPPAAPAEGGAAPAEAAPAPGEPAKP